MNDRILIVDDAEGVRQTLSAILEDEGYRVAGAGSAAEARATFDSDAHDLVLLDLQLPDGDGLDLLSELQRGHPELPVIVISGHGNIDSAISATRLGAYDFLEKPLSLERVVLTVGNALDKARVSRRLALLSSRFERTRELIGESPVMRRLKLDLKRAAASDSRILIMGKNGTGKELVARQLHALSGRADHAFVEVNCAAIPEELIESELFGHVKGSFTGATSDRAGRFEQADGGTLFLDEVADMSLKTQAKVLRALQEQRFERVGGSKRVQVDVRVIAATNKSLEDEIRDNRFREDLYFRLAVIPLRVPPLRERRDDVPLLIDHFAALYARELGRGAQRLQPEALASLTAYDWPGNVRELRNVVERMMIMVPGEEITVENLPPAMRTETSESSKIDLDDGFDSLREARAAFEKRFIQRRLNEHGGNVSRAAEALNIERSNLYRKIRAHGIEIRRE